MAFLMLLLGLFMLSKQEPIRLNRAIYHWKSSFTRTNYETDETKFLRQHQIQKIYIKMLDVDYSEAGLIIPVSKTNLNFQINPKEDSIEYVPVVYISNKVFQFMPTQEIEAYAKLFLEHTLRIETYTQMSVKEIQIDCDWTEGSKEKYFLLLQKMRYWMPNLLYSSTLRLYPYKYRSKLGIPPVNRVMLMLYNMENAKKIEVQNSLFDPNLAAKYMKDKKYPLPMDFAIPAFSWSLVFRHGQFLRVFSNNILDELERSKNSYVEHNGYQLRRLRYNRYIVESPPSFFNDFDLRAGDIIKIESCGGDELKQATNLIARMKPKPNSTIAIFDFDMDDLNKISHEDIEAAFTPLF